MKNQYSLSEKFSLLYSVILTKLFYKDARLIRRPFHCRGKARLEFKKGFTTGYNCRFDLLGNDKDKEKKLKIGVNCKIGDNVHIVASKSVTIGDNCLIASKVFISDTSHGMYNNNIEQQSSPEIPPDKRKLYSEGVIIQDNVWIGENVCILMGTKIGSGSIIGANSVVTKDIPNNCIVAGIPGRVIKRWDQELKKWVKEEEKE